MKRLIASLALATIISIGCAPTQPFVPAFPMEKGKGELRFSVGYGTTGGRPFSFQWSGYYAVSNRNAVGLTFGAWFVPTVASYVHYWPSSDVWLNYQVHKTILWSLNPNIEIDLGYTDGSLNKHKYTAGRTGLGLYITPLWDSASNRTTHRYTPVAIQSGQRQRNSFAAEGEIIWGYSQWKARAMREKHHPPDSMEAWDFQPRIIPHDEVSSIDTMWGPRWSPGYIINLDSTRSIVISPSDPYPDCSILQPRQDRKGCVSSL